MNVIAVIDGGARLGRTSTNEGSKARTKGVAKEAAKGEAKEGAATAVHP